MPRAVATYRNLHCHSCDRKWGEVVWNYSADWNSDRSRPTCTCPTPHVEILPRLGAGRIAQVRASQRAIVYQMPDGSYENPMTNSYDDPGALDCVARGGVRLDFPSIHDLRSHNRQ